jgi:hypothetical protein
MSCPELRCVKPDPAEAAELVALEAVAHPEREHRRLAAVRDELERSGVPDAPGEPAREVQALVAIVASYGRDARALLRPARSPPSP